MNKCIEISNELKEISSLIAGIDNSNVFNIPGGYFETLSDTVLICIKQESATTNIDKVQEDTLPNNYFNSLASNIIAKIKAQEEVLVIDELKEISPVLAGINKTNLFELPGQYFDNFSSSVLSQTDNGYVPVFLQHVNTIQTFEVPHEYFDQLPAAILAKTKQAQSARVIFMPKRNIFIKYASAAVITGALALGVFKYFNNPLNTTGNTTIVQLEPSIEKGKNMDDRKFNEALNNLTEEDIAQYLVNNGSDADIAGLTSNMEEIELPKQEDYLLDNTTLDNFLQQIDSKKFIN